MFAYLSIFFIASLVYFSPRNTKGLYIFFVIAMILIAGFRDMIGGYDVWIYAVIFENIANNSIKIVFESGFNLYYKFLYLFNSSREFMFFITALLMLGLHAISVSKWSQHRGMAIFIYFGKFFLFSFVYLRQGIAMAVLWLSIPFLFQKKRALAVLFLIVAFFLHKTAIAFAPIIFLADFKFKKIHFFIIIGVAALVSLTSLGTFFASYISDSFDEKYEGYASGFTSVNIFYLIETLFIVFLLSKFQSLFYTTKQGVLIFNGFLFYAFFIIVSLTNATFVRLSWFYLIFYASGLVYIYYFYKDTSDKQVYKMILYIYFSLIFFRFLFYFDGGDFIPYKSIFQDFDRGGMFDEFEYR